MNLFDLPNEVLLTIIDAIPVLECCPFVVVYAAQLLHRNMIRDVPPAEMLAMKYFSVHGTWPRIPNYARGPYFQRLPPELWFMVGDYLKPEDKLNFAVSIWHVMVPTWSSRNYAGRIWPHHLNGPGPPTTCQQAGGQGSIRDERI